MGVWGHLYVDRAGFFFVKDSTEDFIFLHSVGVPPAEAVHIRAAEGGGHSERGQRQALREDQVSAELPRHRTFVCVVLIKTLEALFFFFFFFFLI